ncbi:MAG: hypothetical protein IJ391_02565 [Clostridia bacterium]|nr:hypothetical protein [Clostridia bacterium]
MTKKFSKMNEAAWVLGILICGFGIALCTKADLGLSMIAAPPFILHCRLSQLYTVFTQGVCEYLWEGVLLVVLCAVILRFKWRYLLSFITAVLSGFAIDFWLLVLGGGTPYESMALRIIAFVIGSASISFAIAFFFRTSMPLQVYELFVAEITDKYGFDQTKVKSLFDISMFVITVILAVFVNKSAQGIGIGTVIVTLLNSPMIALAGKILDRFFTFEARFPRLLSFVGQKCN